MKKQQTDKALTKQDLIEALKPLARKSDLANLVTKDELKQSLAGLATKEELKQVIAPLATKEEVKQAIAPLATKTDVIKSTEALAAIVNQGFQEMQEFMTIEFTGVKQRLNNLEQDREIITKVKKALAL